MEKQIIKSIIIEYQQFVENVNLLKRSIVTEPNLNYVFVGMRRAGKSHILYQIIQEKLKKECVIEDILFINFEDERFIGATSDDLSLILDSYKELYNRTPIVFLDEIQVVEGWQKFVRRLADTQHRIFVTGSNAEMLSSEIATTLGGRFMIHEVYPYSFEEYLSAHQIPLKKNWQYSDTKNKVVQLAQTYLEFGGLPEILAVHDKRPWLSGLYQKIFFGDIITRYSIRNDFAMKLMVKKLAESVMHPISFNRLANIVSSAGSKTSVTTMIEYIKYAQTSWLIFSLPNYALTLREKEAIKKYYFSDNGVLQLFLINGLSILLENLVAIHLWKQFADKLYFYNKNVEVDFYVPSEGLAIQACYDISDSYTLQREAGALLKLSKVQKVKHAYIITNDDEQTIVYNGLSIEIIPFWKWMIISGFELSKQ